MNKNTSTFANFLRNGKNRFLIVVFMSIITDILSNMSFIYNRRQIGSFITVIIVLSLILSIGLSISHFLAVIACDSRIKHFYKKGISKIWSIIRLIFFYSFWSWILSLIFYIIISALTTAITGMEGEGLGVSLLFSLIPAFFVWIASFILGLVTVIINYKSYPQGLKN